MLSVPRSLGDLTRNIRAIVEDYSIKTPCYLGKSCEIVDTEDTSIKEVKAIERALLSVFNEIVIALKVRAKDLYAFKGIITIYDWKLQLDRQYPSEIGKDTYFPQLMERIECVYKSMALEESHPHLAKAIREYREDDRSKRALGEELKVHARAQHLLSHLMFQKQLVPFYSQFNLFHALAYFCDNHYGLQQITMPSDLQDSKDLIRATNEFYFSLESISAKDLSAISSVSFTLGLLYAKSLFDSREGDQTKKIINFNTYSLTQLQAKKIVFEIHYALENEALSSLHRGSLIRALNMIKRHFIVIKKTGFVESSLHGKFIDGKNKISRAAEGIEKEKQSELIGSRFMDRMRAWGFEQEGKRKLNPSEYDDFAVDMYCHIDLQTLLAEFQLSLSLYDELYVLGHQKIMEEIPGLKGLKKIECIKYRRAIHDQELFSPLKKSRFPIEDSGEGLASDPQEDKVNEPLKTLIKRKGKQSCKAIRRFHLYTSELLQEQAVSTSDAENDLPKISAAKMNLNYDDRVIEWFDNPELALSKPPYLSYSAEKKARAVIHHTFPKIIDEYVGSFGVESVRHNERSGKQERHVSIPALVKFDDGKEDHVILAYCFTSEGLLYHRCSSLKPLDDIVGELARKGYWEMDFPTLEESQKQSRKLLKMQQSEISDYGIVLEETNLCKVKIRNEKNKATYTIVNINN